MAASPARVGLLGLGPMGAPIARRLARTGALTVWNRTAAKALPFPALGARVAGTPAEAAEPVVLTVLPDLAQVHEVLEGPTGLLAGWRERGVAKPVLVVHGTVSPRAVASFADAIRRDAGVVVVDAPLSGGTVGAENGTLSIMVGGPAETVAALSPLFARYGSRISRFGEVGSGSLAKACNQIVVASTVAAVSEALALARSAGLDLATLVEILRNGLAGSEVLEQKAQKWLSGDFSDGGSARNQLKDLRFVRDAAEAHGLDLAVTASVTGLFEAMVERGDADLDHTGVLRTVLARSGVALPVRDSDAPDPR